MTPVFIALSAHVQGVKNVNHNMGTMYRVSAVFKKALHNTVFSLREEGGLRGSVKDYLLVLIEVFFARRIRLRRYERLLVQNCDFAPIRASCSKVSGRRESSLTNHFFSEN